MKKQILKNSYIYQELNEKLKKKFNTQDLVFLTVAEIYIPKNCDKNLIFRYLEKIWFKEKNFIFYVMENKIAICCPNFAVNKELEVSFDIMKQYLSFGEGLENLNKIGSIRNGTFFLLIAVSLLTFFLISIFIPTVSLTLPVIVIPLLLTGIFINLILFCSLSLPGYIDLLTAKRGFYDYKKRLMDSIIFSHQICESEDVSSQPAKALNPDKVKASPISIPKSHSDVPSTSGVNRGFFVKRASYFDSFESLEDQNSLTNSH